MLATRPARPEICAPSKETIASPSKSPAASAGPGDHLGDQGAASTVDPIGQTDAKEALGPQLTPGSSTQPLDCRQHLGIGDGEAQVVGRDALLGDRDEGGDAHHLTERVHQRPARVARGDGRIGLDQPLQC